jgi:hypothetical protein
MHDMQASIATIANIKDSGSSNEKNPRCDSPLKPNASMVYATIDPAILSAKHFAGTLALANRYTHDSRVV